MIGVPDDLQPDAVFVAIAEHEWLSGTQNTGVYANWNDTHLKLPNLHKHYSAAIVQDIPHSVRSALPPTFPLLQVTNSYDVIPALGKYARQHIAGPVIAVTGTVGKSSVRMMLQHILKDAFKIVATRGNHNSRTGVALTLARCFEPPEVVLVEVALSGLWTRNGGVGPLLQPTIAIITEIGIGQAGPEDTARFKARICNGMADGGIAILNHDMDYFDLCKREVEAFGARVITYGFHENADFRISEYDPGLETSRFSITFNGQTYSGSTGRPGKGMVRNALAVLVAAVLCGLSPQHVLNSLSQFVLPERLVAQNLSLGPTKSVTLINDSYNAEILSMRSALEVMGNYKGSGARRIAVLGRIINLGNDTRSIHAGLLPFILEAKADKVFLHGDEMTHLRDVIPPDLLGGHFSNAEALVGAVMKTLNDGDVILVKGDVRDTDFGRVPNLIVRSANG
ncbi:MAG: Mur ligase family protein [Brucella intermedia]